MQEDRFPRLKKKISAFLTGENGKISKQSLLSLGSFISAVAIGGILAANQAVAHTNNCVHTNSMETHFASTGLRAVHSHNVVTEHPVTASKPNEQNC